MRLIKIFGTKHIKLNRTLRLSKTITEEEGLTTFKKDKLANILN